MLSDISNITNNIDLLYILLRNSLLSYKFKKYSQLLVKYSLSLSFNSEHSIINILQFCIFSLIDLIVNFVCSNLSSLV